MKGKVHNSSHGHRASSQKAEDILPGIVVLDKDNKKSVSLSLVRVEKWSIIDIHA